MVCDLDKRCQKEFKNDLLQVLLRCNPRPETRFCCAIEEGEAWFFGDHQAIYAAYPQANKAVLENYQRDSICGTWEKLADALYPGGSEELKSRDWQSIGAEKSRWAEYITPHMEPERNLSPSFCYFRDKIKELKSV